MKEKINIRNKKAHYEYNITQEYTAGIILLGSEIKSIRNNKVSISDAHCLIKDNEVFIKNLHISEYHSSGYINHEPKRERKLLLNKKEIEKMLSKVKEKGMTIIPTRLFINNKGMAKIDIGLAKGKKIFDKRKDLKEKEIKAKINRLKNNF